MRSGRGFTLVELLIVVLILGALAAIAIPRASQSATTAKTNACKTNVDIINKQIELYNAETGDWPISLTWLVVQHPEYFPDGRPECPFGLAYNIDPSTNRACEHSH